ncbi:MAG: hypothetical protein LAP85_23365 [Acidobacteriia bacterium]|nr:hypothetical protein [Terriglobia bacterium]
MNALRRYQVQGRQVLWHPECIGGFREDRRAGLIYGPYKLSDGTFANNAEEASTREDFCPYCGRT